MRKPKYNFSKDNPYNTFGQKQFLDANTGKTVNMVTNDYRSLSDKGAVAFSDTTVDPDSTWAKYLQYLPEHLIIDYLTKEQFGGDEDMIEKFYKKTFMVHKIALSSLPEETLEFLVNRYK